MVEIKSREEANKYYKIVNEIIDNFIDNTNARPVEVYSYIKKNLSKFISDNKLSDVVGIKRIVNDIIEHRKYMQDDKIVTFESYNRIYEYISDLKSNNTRKEKILSDYFHISSGHIEPLNQDLNIYEIKDFDGKMLVTILSDNDLELIRKKLKKLLSERISSQSVVLEPTVQNYIGSVSDLSIQNFLDSEKLTNFLDSKITIDSCVEYFKFYIMDHVNLQDFELQFLGDSNGYKIWKFTNR